MASKRRIRRKMRENKTRYSSPQKAKSAAYHMRKEKKEILTTFIAHSVTDSTMAILPPNIPTSEENENHLREDTTNRQTRAPPANTFSLPLVPLFVPVFLFSLTL